MGTLEVRVFSTKLYVGIQSLETVYRIIRTSFGIIACLGGCLRAAATLNALSPLFVSNQKQRRPRTSYLSPRQEAREQMKPNELTTAPAPATRNHTPSTRLGAADDDRLGWVRPMIKLPFVGIRWLCMYAACWRRLSLTDIMV